VKQFATVFERAAQNKPYCLLMEYVEGQTFKTMLKEEWREFLDVIKDETFQVQLGRILAADVFAGNSDRMFGVHRPDSPPEGWYNAGNLTACGAP
jgi:hypothetical protein